MKTLFVLFLLFSSTSSFAACHLEHSAYYTHGTKHLKTVAVCDDGLTSDDVVVDDGTTSDSVQDQLDRIEDLAIFNYIWND